MRIYKRFSTMERLIKRFNRLNPDYHAELDWLSSYAGFYTVDITEPVCGLTSRYHFHTCAEFREWMDGVVLD